ncbi:hypothetical protein F3087_19230 [Nocardia colli]|uniref:Uncharacterized protein n=1 Tax=Nocardia colli TaxID=2545717 RepID=A0A5N0EDP2_9NOCA|nr:hypothetical protein [Nocardia colli]KAA8887053.1 hypothetical protein F3087_19230 [Nocardia colli]
MRVRIQAGDKPITITYEIQGDEQPLAAGDHVIVEYDVVPDCVKDDVAVQHDERGITVYIPTAIWRVWSSDGADITP